MSTGRRSGSASAAPLSDEHIQVLIRRLENRVKELRAALDLLNGDVQDALGMIDADLNLLKQAHGARPQRGTAPPRTAPSQALQEGHRARQPNKPPGARSEENAVPSRSSAQSHAGRPASAAPAPSHMANAAPTRPGAKQRPIVEQPATRSAAAREAAPQQSKPATAPQPTAAPAAKPAATSGKKQPKKVLNEELADLFERSAWDDTGDMLDEFEDGMGFDEPVGEFEGDGSVVPGEPVEKLDSLLSGYLGEKK